MQRVLGDYIQATAFADEAYCDRPAIYASDDSGMSGYGGIDHTHSGALDAMWLTAKNPGEHNTITFVYTVFARLVLWQFGILIRLVL